MSPDRFEAITSRYPRLKVAVVGDFCLDRYFDIDPRKAETSLETGLPVHNVTWVRCQPGAAGTILNNLVALGVGAIPAVGFAGQDGEGWELLRALERQRGVRLDRFIQTSARSTFTYTKPLLRQEGKAPVELNRLDIKNWTPTPPAVSSAVARAVEDLAREVDAMILLDQVDLAETGVVTRRVLESARAAALLRPELPILADSRQGLSGYPPVILKMNEAELGVMTAAAPGAPLADVQARAADLARRHGRLVFVTLAERGMVGAAPDGSMEHVPAFPVRGEIDIVGAGDAVTASLAAALAAGASLREALALASAAASVVIHQLGTTGTATVDQIRALVA
ncbi:MAG: carbohydrate kinase [Planctomycetes bacterium]|nr:carbohydrate kinase [Planctomycetota bacterium]